MAMATFVNGNAEDQAKAGPHDYVGQLDVEPSSAIAPGETKDLTLKITNKIFSEERLIPSARSAAVHRRTTTFREWTKTAGAGRPAHQRDPDAISFAIFALAYRMPH